MMRGGDVAHVEGRVLAQQHHVEGRQVGRLGGAERVVVALDVADLDRLDPRLDPAVAQRQPVGRVVVERDARAAAASSIRAKVESPRMLMRAMWSIWTATVSGMSGVSPDAWPGAISGPAAPKAMGCPPSPGRPVAVEGRHEVARRPAGNGDRSRRSGGRGPSPPGWAATQCSAARAIRAPAGGRTASSRLGLARPLLDLDEGDRPAAPDDQVDLADRRPVAAGEHAVELQAEVPGGDQLGAAAAALGASAGAGRPQSPASSAASFSASARR